MEIIKKGIAPPKPEPKKYELECTICTTKFKCTTDEAENEMSGGTLGAWSSRYKIACPVCGTFVYFVVTRSVVWLGNNATVFDETER